MINVSELKSDYLEAIKDLLSKFQAAFLTKIQKLIESIGEIYNQLFQSIELEPNTLEEYIEIKGYLTSDSFKIKRNRMIEDIKALKNCISCVDKFLIPLEENLFQVSLEAFTWQTKIKAFRKAAKFRLNEMKPKFYKVLEERKNVLRTQFNYLRKESQKFEDYYELNQAFQICQIAREIVNGYHELIANSKTINGQEKFLGFSTTEFDEFETCYNEFEKFHLLWDFAEKWKFVKNIFDIFFLFFN